MSVSAGQPEGRGLEEQLLVDDLSRTQIVMYAGASGDYNPLHSDEKFAREVAGYPGIFAHGMLTMGMTGRVVTDWFDVGRVTKYGVRFVRQVWPGATLTATAVGRRHPRGGRRAVRRRVDHHRRRRRAPPSSPAPPPPDSTRSPPHHVVAPQLCRHAHSCDAETSSATRRSDVHDLVIRGGTVVDGLGSAPCTADVAVNDGRIAEIGRVDGPARETVDADGLLVTRRASSTCTRTTTARRRGTRSSDRRAGTASPPSSSATAVSASRRCTRAASRAGRAHGGRRGHPRHRALGGHRLAVGVVPRVPRRARRATAHDRRRYARAPRRGARVRDGRARRHRGRHPRRPRGDGRDRARGHGRRRARHLDVAHPRPPHEPRRRGPGHLRRRGGAARARRRPARARRRRVRGRAARHGRRSQRRRARRARAPRPPRCAAGPGSPIRWCRRTPSSTGGGCCSTARASSGRRACRSTPRSPTAPPDPVRPPEQEQRVLHPPELPRARGVATHRTPRTHARPRGAVPHPRRAQRRVDHPLASFVYETFSNMLPVRQPMDWEPTPDDTMAAIAEHEGRPRRRSSTTSSPRATGATW